MLQVNSTYVTNQKPSKLTYCYLSEKSYRLLAQRLRISNVTVDNLTKSGEIRKLDTTLMADYTDDYNVPHRRDKHPC